MVEKYNIAHWILKGDLQFENCNKVENWKDSESKRKKKSVISQH